MLSHLPPLAHNPIIVATLDLPDPITLVNGSQHDYSKGEINSFKWETPCPVLHTHLQITLLEPPREPAPPTKITATVLEKGVETSHQLKLYTLNKCAHFIRVATAAYSETGKGDFRVFAHKLPILILAHPYVLLQKNQKIEAQKPISPPMPEWILRRFHSIPEFPREWRGSRDLTVVTVLTVNFRKLLLTRALSCVWGERASAFVLLLFFYSHYGDSSKKHHG
jgi:hypothetical protein